MSPLTPGSVARIYRDGTLVAPAVDIPAEGRFELRGLQPGVYELVDETGKDCVVEVTHETEVIRIGSRGSDKGPVAAADSTRQLDRPEAPPEPEPVHPPAQKSAIVDRPKGEWRPRRRKARG